MASILGALTEKGSITIPAEMRARLGLKPHDRIAIEIDGDDLRLRPLRSRLVAGFGTATPVQRPEDFRARREQFEQDVAAEVVSETE